jgi:hypothetical protein
LVAARPDIASLPPSNMSSTQLIGNFRGFFI